MKYLHLIRLCFDAKVMVGLVVCQPLSNEPPEEPEEDKVRTLNKRVITMKNPLKWMRLPSV